MLGSIAETVLIEGWLTRILHGVIDNYFKEQKIMSSIQTLIDKAVATKAKIDGISDSQALLASAIDEVTTKQDTAITKLGELGDEIALLKTQITDPAALDAVDTAFSAASDSADAAATAAAGLTGKVSTVSSGIDAVLAKEDAIK